MGNESNNKNYPTDWEKFALTEMIRQLSFRAMDTFVDHRDSIEPLLKLDAALVDGLPAFVGQPDERTLLGIMLFLRMSIVSRTAAQLIFSGQQLEANAIMRATLECAVYGWAIIVNDEMRQAWITRLTDPSGRKAAKKVLGWSRMMGLLADANPPLAEHIQELYELFIDFGGHPNAQAVVTGVETVVNPDGGQVVAMSQIYLTRESLEENVQAMVCVLHSGIALLKLALPHRARQTNFEETVERIFDEIGIRQLMQTGYFG